MLDSQGDREPCGSMLGLATRTRVNLFRLLQNSREPRIPTELPDPLARPGDPSRRARRVTLKPCPA